MSSVPTPLATSDPATTPVPSPCVSVCRMDARTGLCEGCYRTIDEIARWSALPDAERRAVWRAIAARRAAAGATPSSVAGRPPTK
ncbi:MAG: DUF1289 domain-containing protein [Pseudomonadota bacterium]